MKTKKKKMADVIDLFGKTKKFLISVLCLECDYRFYFLGTVETNLWKIPCEKCKDAKSYGAVVPQEYIDEVRDLKPS